MGVFEYSVWIKAAPETVWGIYVDPARVVDWQTRRPVVAATAFDELRPAI